MKTDMELMLEYQTKTRELVDKLIDDMQKLINLVNMLQEDVYKKNAK